MKFLFSLLALLIATDSCESSKSALENSKIQQQSLYGSYSVSQIGENKSVSKDLMITFDENSDKVTGFLGCNNFFGTYTLENKNITFSNISSSKKFCGKEISLVEKTLLQTLNKVNSFAIKDNVLSLLEDETTLIKATQSVLAKKSDAKDNSETEIKYRTSTRGFFELIDISKSNISISKDRSLKSIDKYNCKKEDWEELSRLIDGIDLETFQKLNAPTSKRFSDIAAQANLIIKLGDIEYMTPAFDHGNPPKEIEVLVNKVLSIRESVVKQ